MTCPRCGYCEHCGRPFQPYQSPYYSNPFTNIGQFNTPNQPISLGGQHSVVNEQKTCDR